MEDRLAMLFLGLIALASLVQAAFLIVLAAGARRVGRRVDELQQRLDRELRPSLENLVHVSRNVAELSAIAAFQGRRIDNLVDRTLGRVDESAARAEEAIQRPLNPLAGVMPILRGFKTGFDMYRRLGGLQARATSRRRQYEPEDEQLFI
jgi:hypothetical protein